MVERFVLGWEQLGYEGSDMTPEYVFDPDRKWRFDLAWPSVKVAIEFDGRGWGHQSHKGRDQDNAKQNAATAAGWRVLRYSSSGLSMKRMPDVVEEVMRAISVSAEGRGLAAS